MSMRLWKWGVVCALALSACQPKPGGSQSGTKGGAPAADAKAAGASDCHAYQAGKDNVIRTFCDGPGKAEFTVGSTSGKVGGGTCERTGPMFSFNAGVVSMATSAARPDYFGLTMTKSTGDFTGAILAITYGGKSWGSAEIHGSVGPKGGTFEGPVRAVGSNEEMVVKGAFSC